MPWLKKMRVDDAFHGLIDGGVGEDDVGGFSAELERVVFFVPASLRWISRPTSVEPVNAILSTSG